MYPQLPSTSAETCKLSSLPVQTYEPCSSQSATSTSSPSHTQTLHYSDPAVPLCGPLTPYFTMQETAQYSWLEPSFTNAESDPSSITDVPIASRQASSFSSAISEADLSGIDFMSKTDEWILGFSAGVELHLPGANRSSDFTAGYLEGIIRAPAVCSTASSDKSSRISWQDQSQPLLIRGGKSSVSVGLTQRHLSSAPSGQTNPATSNAPSAAPLVPCMLGDNGALWSFDPSDGCAAAPPILQTPSMLPLDTFNIGQMSAPLTETPKTHATIVVASGFPLGSVIRTALEEDVSLDETWKKCPGIRKARCHLEAAASEVVWARTAGNHELAEKAETDALSCVATLRRRQKKNKSQRSKRSESALSRSTSPCKAASVDGFVPCSHMDVSAIRLTPPLEDALNEPDADQTPPLKRSTSGLLLGTSGVLPTICELESQEPGVEIPSSSMTSLVPPVGVYSNKGLATRSPTIEKTLPTSCAYAPKSAAKGQAKLQCKVHGVEEGAEPHTTS